MDQAIQQSDSNVVDLGGKRAVEIIIHISEDLDEAQRNDLILSLKESAGITDADFCPLRKHLILVNYDRGVYSSLDVLNDVTSRNLSARLIGPV